MVSTRFGGGCHAAFVCSGERSDYLCLNDIVVDVTPERRYSLWSHKYQKFSIDTETNDKWKADEQCAAMNKRYPDCKFHVVEWVYPGDPE